jgi:hypothetical protein
MTKQTNRGKGFLNVLWLIPIIALGYIGWMNLLPLRSTETYFVDVGGNDISGKAVITGPFDRISNKKEVGGISFRELENDLVYFELNDLRLKDADEIGVRIKFKDEFPSGGRLLLGSRNKQEWSYSWQEVFVSDNKWQTNHKSILQSSEDNGWLIARANWIKEDLFIDNNKLSFCLSTPHLKKQPDKVIPIDWIEISLKILPIWERVKWGS